MQLLTTHLQPMLHTLYLKVMHMQIVSFHQVQYSLH